MINRYINDFISKLKLNAIPSHRINVLEDIAANLRINNNLNIKSLDCGVVAPGFNTNPWKYDVYDNGNAVDPLDGAAFFLYGNLYNTNYVLWYPFIEEDNMSRFRFEFTF